jgi:hypothetical protein
LAGTVIFVSVFLVANSINVLCLLAPGFAAPILKGFRVAVVGGLTGLGMAHPLLGFIASLIVFHICMILAGRAFRLSVWGSLFSFDLIFRRWRHAHAKDYAQEKSQNPEELRSREIQAFAGALAKKTLKIPKRSLGKLYYEDGKLYFSYRRLFLFPRIVPIEGDWLLGKTLTAPIIALARPNGGRGELFFFRLKERGHEEFLRYLLLAPGIETFGLRKGAVKLSAWIKSLFQGSKDLPLTA